MEVISAHYRTSDLNVNDATMRIVQYIQTTWICQCMGVNMFSACTGNCKVCTVDESVTPIVTVCKECNSVFALKTADKTCIGTYASDNPSRPYSINVDCS